MSAWVKCEICGTDSCIGHSPEDCAAALEYRRIYATGDEAAMDEHMRARQAKIDAKTPRLYCEWCQKVFIAVAHRHLRGEVVLYEAKHATQA